jgi:NAD(P)-dependent dehydrogenase (short-subunit alcohol dehydrogenase family)
MSGRHNDCEHEGRTPEEVRQRRLATIPIGRLLRPEEHANAVAFFASDEASGINGQALDVDGGSIWGWTDYESYRSSRKKWVQQEIERKSK